MRFTWIIGAMGLMRLEQEDRKLVGMLMRRLLLCYLYDFIMLMGTFNQEWD